MDRSRRVPGSVAVLLGLALLGGLATALSVARAVAAERADDERAVALVSERLSAGLSRSLASLGVADAMAVDGEVTADEFAAFAADVLPGSNFLALSFAMVVPESERSEWESAVGMPMLDTDGEGGFVDSASRPVHAAVQFVAPATELTSRVLGFDLLSDPIRANGAAQADTADDSVVVGPIRLAASALPGVFAINAVRGPDRAVIGYVASGINLDDGLLQQLETLPGIRPVEISMDGEPLVEQDWSGGETKSFALGGRTFEVRTGDDDEVSWLLPLAVAASTAILIVGAYIAGRRERRSAQRQRWLMTRNRHLAQIAAELVGATTTDGILRVVSQSARHVLGAQHARVGRRLLSDPNMIEVVEDDPSSGTPAKFQLQSIDERTPLTDAARDNTTVFVADAEAFDAAYPGPITDSLRGVAATRLCVPLGLGNEPSVSALEFAWDKPQAPRQRDDIKDGAQMLAQMVGRAYERALLRELVQSRVELLSEFAGALAAAHTVDDVHAAVGSLLPPLLDLDSASLVSEVPADGTSMQVYPPSSPGGDYLVLARRDGTPWTPTAEALARAVIELLEGASARARLYDHQRSVLELLQASLLTPAPDVPGFGIAVAYRSAIEAVGIGGDWYSVIDGVDALYAVIGDVAGHGPEAVAVMAQVKTIVRHLLTGGMPINEVIEHASIHMESRHAYASAVIVRIDKRAETLTYVNCGHPFPFINDGHSTRMLATTHRQWLGVPSPPIEPSSAPFAAGSTVVLITDGLIEVRDVAMDDSMQELLTHLDAACHDPAPLVEDLLERRSNQRTVNTVDDDVAIVVVRRNSAPIG